MTRATHLHLVFQAADDGTARQRLLLLTHHFPPSDAVGAIRWHKFAVLLGRAGWTFDIVCGRPPETAGEIPNDLPPGTRLWHCDFQESLAVRAENAMFAVYGRAKRAATSRRCATAEEGAAVGVVRTEGVRATDVRWNLGTARGWVRLWFTLRDLSARAAGARQVERAALHVADPKEHRAIITSGPPHHWHVGGGRAARTVGLPLVIDLRDPWGVTDLVHEYFATPSWIAASSRDERRAVERADLVVANTDTLRDALARRYPNAANRIITVMNGIDDDPMPAGAAGPTFTIGYAGTIYFGRDPRPLFAGAARVVTELQLTPEEFQIRFIGDATHYGGIPLQALARQAGLESHVRVGGRVSRSEAHRFLAACHMLVSLPWEDGLTIPAKLFEYMRFPAWLLVFADPGSAMDLLLRGHDADVVGNADVAGVAAAIRRRYRQFRGGERPAPMTADSALSREAQAAVLLSAIEHLRRSDGASTWKTPA
jgi:glycosyltransferase involved in cell wall biosynthesis